MNRMACSRVTEGKPLRKSSRVELPSIWSIRAWTGTRVPLKQGSPLMRSGSTQMISSSRALCSNVTILDYSKLLGRARRGAGAAGALGTLRTLAEFAMPTARLYNPAHQNGGGPHESAHVSVAFRPAIRGRRVSSEDVRRQSYARIQPTSFSLVFQ